MDTTQLPDTIFLSLSEIIGRAEVPAKEKTDKRKAKSAKPAIKALIPVSRTTWWRGVRSGKYPQGVKISDRRTVWRTEDLISHINSLK